MRIVAVGEDRASSEAAVRLAREQPGVWAAAGVHPHHARRAGSDLERWLSPCCADPVTVAVGEIGLDYHYDRSPRDVQREVFRRQLALAQTLKLPVVIHSREALADTLSVLRESAQPGRTDQDSPRGVMHCFGYDWEAAKLFLALGFVISIPATVTYPRADSIREVARRVPADRLVLETDAPVLAPQSHRGRRNEPAYLVETAHAVAALRTVTLASLAAQTTANANRLFRLPEPVDHPDKLSGVPA